MLYTDVILNVLLKTVTIFICKAIPLHVFKEFWIFTLDCDVHVHYNVNV